MVAVFIITLIVFSTGILLGTLISTGKISFLSQELEEARSSVEGMELQFLIADTVGPEASCTYLSKQSEIVGVQADALGEKLALAEEAGKFGPTFTTVKQAYTNLLIQDWLIFNRLKKTCNTNQTLILYFYNNQNCEHCHEQGAVLTYLKKKMGGQLLIFPIDVGLDTPIVNLLLDIYDVREYPTVVINDKISTGFISATELQKKIEGAGSSA